MKPRRRLTAEESKGLLVEAGLEMFDTEGMAPSFDAITLERAVRSTGVSRSSAYNIWSDENTEYSPQEAFQWEVIKHLIADATVSQTTDAFLSAGTAALESGLEGIELRRELIRRAANAHLVGLEQRRSLRIVYALLASANSVPEASVNQQLMQWLRDNEANFRDRLISGAFLPFAVAVNYVPRPEFDPDLVWLQFTAALMSVGDGLFSRTRLTSPDVLYGVLPADGDPEGWSLYAIAVDALVERFFEPGPQAD